MGIQIMAPNEQPKKSHFMDAVIILVIVLLIGSSIALFIFGMGDYSEKKNMELTWAEIIHLAETEDPEAEPEEFIDEAGNTILITAEVAANDYLYKPINLPALKELNADTSGYIYIPNTEVNYPILKETVPEDYFYLDHNFYRNYDKYGSIFEISDLERNVPDIDNAVNIIFGHHMASGAMFSGIYAYEDQAFNTNPIYVYRDDMRVEYAVFAVCVVNKNDPLYDFDTYEIESQNYEDLLNRLVADSTVTCDATMPGTDEHIIVLSTCKGASGTSERLIVCAKEVRRVVVPEYYNNLDDVHEYGGEEEAIDPYEEGIDTSNGNSINDLLTTEQESEEEE